MTASQASTIAAIGSGSVCVLLIAVVATRPVWLHFAWAWRERRSRNRRGGSIL